MKKDTTHLLADVLPAVLNEDSFWPFEPRTAQETGIPELLQESLICQQLLNAGTLSGRNLSERIGLPFPLIEQQIGTMRVRQLVTHARPAPLNDFYYSLTENGQKRALGHQKVCSYAGPAPVPLMDYVLSVEAQASHYEPITEAKLKAALSEVTYDSSWLDFLGPAVNCTAGIFLYGAPGNGKTTLAKCLTACRGEEIWIPHAIIDDGTIIKFFDAAYHVPVASTATPSKIVATQDYDHRWIRVRRPTVIVGGELTLDNLEVRHDPRSNISEAPLQLKSNCGCLLIDDFGRQRVEPAALLNRWIVPLESKIDYLTLASGKKISVPFEQTIIFSTNLQPESLVDEAFMRRVPFKIEIGNPSIAEYIELFRRSCDAMGIEWRPKIVDEFIHKHYQLAARPMRRCHPRDLLQQVRALSAYHGERPDLRHDLLDKACSNYFGANSPIVESPLPGQAPSEPELVLPPSMVNSQSMYRPSLVNPPPHRPNAQEASMSPSSLKPIHPSERRLPLPNRVAPIPPLSPAASDSLPLQTEVVVISTSPNSRSL